MIRGSVVFPEPEGPSRARSAPLGTSRLTLSSARNLSKRLVTRVIRMPIRSEYHRTRPDEERELRALLGAEHPVQPVERAHGRLPHALRALDPRPSRLGGPGRVEAVLGEQVGERRRHPPVVDRGLRALGLELVQDARQLARLRLGLADAPEALLELRVAEVAAHLRLGDQPIDVVAHLLQGADVGVRGEAVERRLEAEAGLRARQAGEHAHPLLAQPGDLALEGDQVLLGAFGLFGELGQLGRETRHLRPEPVAAPDQVEGHGVVVALDRDLELAAGAPQLGRLALELLRELAAEVDDAGRGLAQLRVLRHALLDGRDVDRVRVALLAAADPARGETAQEVPDSSDEWHGLSFTP